MTDFTVAIMVLENAKKNKLISSGELSTARNLLRSEERIQALIQTNKDLRDIIDNQFSIITKLKFILKDMKKLVNKEEVKDV